MKELSIEEKAKRYDEALKVLHKYDGANIMFSQSLKEEMFPELREESEDERIRKALLGLISTYLRGNENGKIHDVYAKDILAWLEKQGEQKPADKVKPKFHEGDWITNGDYTWKIAEVKPLDYILQSQDGNIVDDTISYVDEQFHSFTIEDAKDGDVLVCESGWTCIFKTLVNDENFSSYCFMDNTKWFCETGSEGHTLKEEFVKAYNGKIYPATKEQRNLLFQKMKEAGYEWDAEKKELKKIEQKPAEIIKWSPQEESCICQLESLVKEQWRKAERVHNSINIKKMSELMFFLKTLNPNKKPQRIISAETKEVMYDKPAWSEEDEEYLKHAIEDFQKLGDSYLTFWLKSLKDRVQPKQEWSEKDNQYLCGLIGLIEQSKAELPITLKGKTADNCIDWLKSVRPQNRWKPSKEQIVALESATENCAYSEYQDCLRELIGQLKKLREE